MAKGNPNPERHLENLRPFKPGESGNPAGRPPNVKYISEHIRDILAEGVLPGENDISGKTNARLIAERLVREAVAGAIQHAVQVLERTEGKVTDKTEHSGSLAVSWAEVLRGADAE